MPFIKVKNGKIRSAKLEFNLVAHCNYSCAECSHLSPYMKISNASIDSFKRDIGALSEVYRVKRFRFVGGEPLLNKDVLLFIRVVRESGIADKIQICTNGSTLHKTSDEVFREIDMLSISWYPDSRCDQAKVARAIDRCNAYDVKLKIEKIDRFRLMQLGTPTANPLLSRIYDSCQIAHTWGCQTFLNGIFYLCSRPLFTASYLSQKGLAAPSFQEIDGCPIHQEDLLDRLISYLQRRDPLESCKYCLGTAGKYIKWRQMGRSEIQSALPIEREAQAAIDPTRLRYLLAWKRAERGILAVVPSLRLARSLNLIQNLTIRD